MTPWQFRRDLEETIRDGLRKVVVAQVNAREWDSAKAFAALLNTAAEAIREKLQTAYSIRRPRKRP